MTADACQKIVFTACQINAVSPISFYNIALCGSLKQVEMAKDALGQCTSHQSIIYICNTAVKVKGRFLRPIPNTVSVTPYVDGTSFHCLANDHLDMDCAKLLPQN